MKNIKNVFIIGLACLAIAFSSCVAEDDEVVVSAPSPPTVDPCAISSPQTFVINGNTWTENLSLPVANSFSYDTQADTDEFGLLYTYFAAKEACKQLGPCWRLPTKDEFISLAMAFGGYYDYSNGWIWGDPQVSFANLVLGGTSGFDGRLGGMRYLDGIIRDIGARGFYWTSDRVGADLAWQFNFFDFNTFGNAMYHTDNGLSCRCIKDEN